MRDIDRYFEQHDEPAKSCLLALRAYILGFAPEVTEMWRYRMPFYAHRGKRFCYLWTEKKSGKPYLGVVDGFRMDHPALIAEQRSRMKIMLIAPEEDLPMQDLNEVLSAAISLL
nr:DUF1801 domain-containing protein [uncultured Dyadobacter sp.]